MASRQIALRERLVAFCKNFLQKIVFKKPLWRIQSNKLPLTPALLPNQPDFSFFAEFSKECVNLRPRTMTQHVLEVAYGCLIEAFEVLQQELLVRRFV